MLKRLDTWPLSEAQAEVLGILQEECAEVIQSVSKLNRMGTNFVIPSSQETALAAFWQEIIDLEVLIELAKEIMPFPNSRTQKRMKLEKIERLKQWSDIDFAKINVDI